MKSDLYVLLRNRQKPKFDMHINGVLLNKTKEVIPIIFNKGKSLKKFLNEDFYIRINWNNSQAGKQRDKLSTIVNTTIPLFVVSENLVLLLEKLVPKQIEFFKLTFLDEHGEESFSNYKIANVINKVDCIDYEKSELSFEFYDREEPDGDIVETEFLAINPDLVPYSLNIFLLDRYKESIIVMKEDLKKKLEEEKISGFVFCKIEDFKN